MPSKICLKCKYGCCKERRSKGINDNKTKEQINRGIEGKIEKGRFKKGKKGRQMEARKDTEVSKEEAKTF